MKYDEDVIYAQSILPESRFVRVLTVLVLISACCSASLTFYQYTFEVSQPQPFKPWNLNKHFLCSSFQAYNLSFFVAGYICDIIYLIKMCMGFRVSYFNEQGDVIVDSTEISNK